ncbi:MAG: serine protease, partial [Planctomycetes bacterium]|nr:serine protease [Planctomycetota bacterium]
MISAKTWITERFVRGRRLLAAGALYCFSFSAIVALAAENVAAMALSAAVQIEIEFEPLFAETEEERGKGHGSGNLVSRDGLVLTCAHIVRQPGKLTLRFSDGEESGAEVVSVDPVLDLALLRAENVPDSAKALDINHSARATLGQEVIFCAAQL